MNADSIAGTTIANTKIMMITLEKIFFTFLFEKLNIFTLSLFLKLINISKLNYITIPFDTLLFFKINENIY